MAGKSRQEFLTWILLWITAVHLTCRTEVVVRFFNISVSNIFGYVMLSALIFITAGEQYSIVKKDTGNSNDNRLRAGKNFKAIKTVGLVLSICFVTWMPCLILTIVSCYNLITQCRRGDLKRPIPVARTWVRATALTSSAFNPSIYTSERASFSKLFAGLFTGCPVSNRSKARATCTGT